MPVCVRTCFKLALQTLADCVFLFFLLFFSSFFCKCCQFFEWGSVVHACNKYFGKQFSKTSARECSQCLEVHTVQIPLLFCEYWSFPATLCRLFCGRLKFPSIFSRVIVGSCAVLPRPYEHSFYCSPGSFS